MRTLKIGHFLGMDEYLLEVGASSTTYESMCVYVTKSGKEFPSILLRLPIMLAVHGTAVSGVFLLSLFLEMIVPPLGFLSGPLAIPAMFFAHKFIGRLLNRDIEAAEKREYERYLTQIGLAEAEKVISDYDNEKFKGLK